MKIMIDGDACPVTKEVEYIAKKNNIKVIIVKNYNHVIRSSYSEVISVDSCSENADLKIANLTEKGDLIVTQDYGLCAMVIAKDAIAINQYGRVINDFNIDFELNKRDLNRENRMKHKKYTKFKKRTKKDNEIFKVEFEKLLKEMMDN
jgi:uncharacterized protein YaiI (UPF0178 family)